MNYILYKTSFFLSWQSGSPDFFCSFHGSEHVDHFEAFFFFNWKMIPPVTHSPQLENSNYIFFFLILKPSLKDLWCDSINWAWQYHAGHTLRSNNKCWPLAHALSSGNKYWPHACLWVSIFLSEFKTYWATYAVKNICTEDNADLYILPSHSTMLPRQRMNYASTN